MNWKVAAILDHAKSSASAIRKNTVDEVLVRRIRYCPAQVLCWEVVSLSITIRIVGKISSTVKEATALLRRPGKPRMEIDNAVYLETAERLADKI